MQKIRKGLKRVEQAVTNEIYELIHVTVNREEIICE